ncbi:MAG: leucine-rich repeat protein [Alistipes sp.]|nr:leucine-rich repeat protein [Alistipes sp.]
MKRQLLTFGLAALLFASCATDPEGLNTTAPLGAPQINISGTIDQHYSTRVDDNGFCDGDQVGLYGVNYTDNNTLPGTLHDEYNQVNNALYTYSKESGAFTSSGSFYYKDVETNIDLYAYYPFAHPESVNAYEFEVALDQNLGTGHAMSDFLWAKATNVTPSESKVSLRFSHRLSLANVILKEGTGFGDGEFAQLDKSVLALNTTRKATIDLSTGIATATGEPEKEGIIMKATDEGFRAIVVPQSVAGSTPLFAITIDGITYHFKRDEVTAYQAGKMAKFTITINRKAHTGTYELVLTDTSIEDWIADIDTYGGEARQYFVVHLDEAGELERKIDEAKKNPAKIKNLKVSGKICAGDFDFMRDKMEILQAVNLKETKVVKCWYYVVTYEGDSSSTTEYFEGALPSTTAECKEIADARAAKLGKKIKSYGSAKVKTTVADNIPVGAFKDKTTLAYFAFPEYITSIAGKAFQGCSLLMGALVIPDSVTEIGTDAFADCTSLTTIDLPVRLEKIEDRAFQCCSGFTGSLTLPSTLKSIGGGAFGSCVGFTGNLILPEGLEELGASAFSGCSKFSGDLRIPESITVIRDRTFYYCKGLKGQLILHDGLSFEGESQFESCRFQGELKLPAYLTVIPSRCFYECSFSSLAPLPKELIEINESAFAYCSRLMGTIELPESVIAIRDYAFRCCRQLEGIVIPSDVGIIMEEAFAGCYGLNKIVCRAAEPPILQSGVFSGVAKDSFTLEVPEESVNKYQADVLWGEFKRIAAHHDFSISRSKMRILNAEHTREFVLRAPSGQSWSIESKPEWVTVTPSSGVGKTEVTVTVNQMTTAEVGEFKIKIMKENSSEYTTETHKGRAGEVVFLLEGKDYRSKINIEQYDYQYGDGDVLTTQRATAVDPKKGVNLVFMGDCFDARDIAKGTYLSGTNQAIEHFFAVEPYKTYRDYFNVYTVFGMSNDSGMGTVDTIRDAKFGSQYTLNEGISPNINTIIDYSLKTESVTKQNFNKSLVVMVENSKEYGGVTLMYSDGSAVAICPMSQDAYPYDFRGIVQHEAGGHGFAKLADEYIYTNGFISSCICPYSHLSDFNSGKQLGWYRNLEATGDMNEVGWSHLIFNPKYSDIVDIYEGGYYHTRGIYRSEPVSCMNNNIPYFSAISRQEIVERIMRYSGQRFSITNFYANDVLDIQGNNTGKASVLDAAPTAISLTGAGKQMPPKYMGHSPFDK